MVIYVTALSIWYKPSGAVIEESCVIVGNYSGFVREVSSLPREAGVKGIR